MACGAPLEAYGQGPVLGGYAFRQGDEGRGYYYGLPSSTVAAPSPAAPGAACGASGGSAEGRGASGGGGEGGGAEGGGAEGGGAEGDEPPSGMSLRALKAELGVRSVETAGLLERSELVHALLQARLVAPQEWLVGLS